MDSSAEVIVVGAGMAGLALAMQLGSRGRSVLLVDKAPPPRDKVCGEGLMPLGMDALEAAGLDPRSLPGHDFLGLVYRSRKQETLLDFAPGVRGRGIRRTALIEALQAAALAHPGVSLTQDEVLGPLRESGELRGVEGRGGKYRGRVVVAADGVQSRLAHAAGMDIRQHGYRMGLRRHYRVPGSAAWDRVRIGLFTPCDIYLTPVGDETVLATTMTTHAGYDAIKDDYEGFLAATPFGGIFGGAEPVSEQLGWHHPLCSQRGHHGGGLLVVGDAGGSLDPCLGMGISLALVTSRLACDAVAGMLDEPRRREEFLAEYGRAHRELFRHYRIFDYIFRLMVISKLRGELLLWAMRHWPDIADAMLGAVAERRPWSRLPWWKLAYPRRRNAGQG